MWAGFEGLERNVRIGKICKKILVSRAQDVTVKPRFVVMISNLR